MPTVAIPETSGLRAGALLTFRQAADHLNVPYWKIQRAAQVGLIPTTTLLNSRRYVRVSDIEAALGRSPVRNGEA